MRPFISKFVNEVGKKDDFFFIQVGANDGVMCDPIRQFIVKHSWGCILVEPVPDYFELLKKKADDLGLKELSMGMSGDFQKAIECGATYIRIGTLLFGERK